MGAETCPVVTTTEDAPAVSSSVRPTVDVSDSSSTCAISICPDDGSSCAVSVCGTAMMPDYAASACDVTTAPSRSTFTVDISHASPSFCSSMDAVIIVGNTSLVGAVATLAPLLLAFGVAPDDSWCTDHRVRVFLGAICRGALRTPTLQKEPRSAHDRIRQEQTSGENSQLTSASPDDDALGLAA